MKDEYIKIRKEHLLRLEKANLELDYLKFNGVRKWDGYEDALSAEKNAGLSFENAYKLLSEAFI